MEVYDKIIWFMLGKATIVKEICDVEYFTNDDIESIRMLDKDRLKFVWEMIMCYVDDFTCGLEDMTCPYCIYYYIDAFDYYVVCRECSYGKLHGFCGKVDSDYRKIINSKKFSNDIFPNKFYKGLIRDIENYTEV